MRQIKEVYDKNPGILGGDTLDFAAFHGHLMALAPPDFYDPALVKWSKGTLPIIPREFVYLPEDKVSVDRLLNQISRGGYDFLVNACDAGREGELIFYSFYEANKLTLPVKRYWASDFTTKNVTAALKNLLPESAKANLRKAAKWRAQFDWLAGMNFSRATSLASGTKVSVGSVMSPTLKVIVDREKEIETFVPEDYWMVSATIKHPNGSYAGTYVLPPKYASSKLTTEAAANDVVSKTGKDGQIIAAETRREETSAPTLYSLTELQKDASKALKFSAKKTLDLAQKLYENKLLSYPRTDSRALPTAFAATVQNNLDSLLAVPELAPYVSALPKGRVSDVMKDKAYVDDAKITDHHAIIPTTDRPNMSKLTKDEAAIYMLVAKRFLSIFMPPRVTEKTVLLTQSNGMTFRSGGIVEIDPGYAVLYPAKKSKADALPLVKKGDSVSIGTPKITKNATKPPERYTTATLLAAMVNIGSTLSQADLRKALRDAGGIGTSATRADILEKLQRLNMVELDRTGHFRPTEFGTNIIATIGDRDVCSPMLRAVWEQKLRQVEAGTFTGSFEREMVEYITEETASLLAFTGKISDKPIVGKCPLCGKPVISGKNFFLCQNYAPPGERTETKCSFILRKEVVQATVTDEMAKRLLQRKHTEPVQMKTKAGKTFIAPLTLALRKNEDGTESYAIAPYFEKKEELDLSKLKESDFLGECPKCGGKVYAGSKFYVCTNKDHGCDFSIAQTIRGGHISPQNIRQMLAGKKSGVINFTWKNGKVGPAQLAFNPDGSLQFVFQK